MGDKGKRDKGKREQQKKGMLSPKEKRQQKKDKHNTASMFTEIATKPKGNRKEG